MLVSLTLQSNLLIPVDKNMKKNPQQTSRNKKEDKPTYLNAKMANTMQCYKVTRYTYHRPIYDLLAAKKTKTKNKGNTKSLSLEKSSKTFLESRQETGPKAETIRGQKEQQD